MIISGMKLEIEAISSFLRKMKKGGREVENRDGVLDLYWLQSKQYRERSPMNIFHKRLI